MPNHARCAVGFYDNDKRYPDLAYVRSHVKNLTFHKWPVDPKLSEIWRKQVAKTRGDVFNPSLALVVLSSVQIIFLWEEELLKTLKRIIRRFL